MEITAADFSVQSNVESAILKCGKYKHPTDNSPEDECRKNSVEEGLGCNQDEESTTKKNVALVIEEMNDQCQSIENKENSSAISDTLKQEETKCFSFCGYFCDLFSWCLSLFLCAYSIAVIITVSACFQSCFKIKPPELFAKFCFVDASVGLVYCIVSVVSVVYRGCLKKGKKQATLSVYEKIFIFFWFFCHIPWLIEGTVILVQARNTTNSDYHCHNGTCVEPIQFCGACDAVLRSQAISMNSIWWTVVLILTGSGVFCSCCGFGLHYCEKRNTSNSEPRRVIQQQSKVIQYAFTKKILRKIKVHFQTFRASSKIKIVFSRSAVSNFLKNRYL